mmetsp:Transcript_10220/g.30780  ORF Transcript_10220/g.30780 Transcript_10220/m.30780 type:complete len:267 (-) Transcript_10220:2709-3509(-)
MHHSKVHTHSPTLRLPPHQAAAPPQQTLQQPQPMTTTSPGLTSKRSAAASRAPCEVMTQQQCRMVGKCGRLGKCGRPRHTWTCGKAPPPNTAPGRGVATHRGTGSIIHSRRSLSLAVRCGTATPAAPLRSLPPRHTLRGLPPPTPPRRPPPRPGGLGPGPLTPPRAKVPHLAAAANRSRRRHRRRRLALQRQGQPAARVAVRHPVAAPHRTHASGGSCLPEPRSPRTSASGRCFQHRSTRSVCARTTCSCASPSVSVAGLPASQTF